MTPIITPHNITLSVDQNIKLRPLADNDLATHVLKWCSDPEVLYYSEGDETEKLDYEDVCGIYGQVSQTAYCFIIEYNGVPIGECWIQQMNRDFLLNKYPNFDLRRIDLVIGEKQYWNKGIGTEVVKKLVDFGFATQNADMIFYMAYDHNKRSIKLAQKVGFTLVEKIDSDSPKAEFEYIMAITKEEYLGIL